MGRLKKTNTEVTPKKRRRQPRHTDKTGATWHSVFLGLLRETCNVTLSADGAGVTRKTAYDHYHLYPDFAAQWDDAKEAAIEQLEAQAWARAKLQSDTLMIFLLKAHKPEKYQEKYQVAQTSLNINWDDLTEDELAAIAAGENPAAVLSRRGR